MQGDGTPFSAGLSRRTRFADHR